MHKDPIVPKRTPSMPQAIKSPDATIVLAWTILKRDLQRFSPQSERACVTST